MTTDPLAYYASPGRHTDLSDLGPQVATVAEAVETVQQLLVYDTVAKDLYGIDLPEVQAAAIHLRDAAAVARLAMAVDPRPLGEPRPPEARVGGRCNAYTLLTVAVLRASGIPARSRCGFGTYFVPGWYEDHWVAEYWDPEADAWLMVDAQLDATWRAALGRPEEGPVRVSAAEFVTGGHAWQAWRRGELDGDRCGLSLIPEHGAFWIASNLRLDFAALNKVEMLPWDLWGLGWEPSQGQEPTDEMLATFDEIAELTVDPDARFAELRTRYDRDDQLRMDGTVFSVAKGDFDYL